MLPHITFREIEYINDIWTFAFSDFVQSRQKKQQQKLSWRLQQWLGVYIAVFITSIPFGLTKYTEKKTPYDNLWIVLYLTTTTDMITFVIWHINSLGKVIWLRLFLSVTLLPGCSCKTCVGFARGETSARNTNIREKESTVTSFIVFVDL